MWGFVIGVFVGVPFGFLICSLLVISSRETRYEEALERAKSEWQGWPKEGE